MGSEELEIARGRKRRQSSSGSDIEQDDEKQIYCLCRSTDTTRFMIQCDKCNEWYHGDCIQVTKKQATTIETYYCPPCISQHANLEIVYTDKFLKAKAKKDGKRSGAHDSSSQEERHDRDSQDDMPSTSAHSVREKEVVVEKEKERKGPPRDPSPRCGRCIGCFRPTDCGKCKGCMTKAECYKRICVAAPDLDDPLERAKTLAAARLEKKEKSGGGEEEEDMKTGREKAKRGRKKGMKKDAIKQERSSSDEAILRTDVEEFERLSTASIMYGVFDALAKKRGRKSAHSAHAETIQCQGPKCANESRENSKYCSDACGLALATWRLREFLPTPLEDYWRVPSVAKERAEEADAAIKKEIEEKHAEKEKIAANMKLLIRYIDSIRYVTPDADATEDTKDEGETLVACTVCAVEQPSKNLAKHVERCFVKLEKQMTFGTMNKGQQNPDDLVCEEYNKVAKTYCKRLRVMCPEHYKGELEASLKVCGCPKAWTGERSSTIDLLFSSVDALLSEGMCYADRKTCTSHHRWIQTMLGLLEQRRYATLSRLDELLEQHHIVASQKRGDALLLMCNQTKRSKPVEELIREYEEGERRARRSPAADTPTITRNVAL